MTLFLNIVPKWQKNQARSIFEAVPVISLPLRPKGINLGWADVKRAGINGKGGSEQGS